MRFYTSRGISIFFHQVVKDWQYLKEPADKQEREISPLSSRVRYLRTTPHFQLSSPIKVYVDT